MKTELAQDAAVALQERLLVFVRAFGLLRPEETPCGQPLSVSEAHALTELSRGVAAGQFELAERLHLDRSSVSRIVAQLIKRGWVERLADQRDGRVTALRLTPAGRRTAAQLARARARKITRLLDSIPPSERGGVLHALDVLAEALHDQQH